MLQLHMLRRIRMATKFAQFVEFCTDSKYVPLGTRCALCGQRLGFFHTGFWSVNAGKLADGFLCGKCMEQLERLLATRHEWMEEGMHHRAAWNLFTSNALHRMPLQKAKELIAAKEASDQEYLASFGSDKTSLFRIEDVIKIEPTAIQVGIVRAKHLKNKVVVFGTAERGSFGKQNRVQIIQGDHADSSLILEAYVFDCEENTLDICLRANMGKQKLSTHETGWLVLDYEDDIQVGSVIVR